MAESEEFLRQLSAEGLPAVWYILSETAMQPRIVGGSPAEVFGTEISASDALVRYVHRDDRSRVLAARLTTLHDRRATRVEYRIDPPGSGTRWVLEVMKVVHHNGSARLIGLVVDVTADHQAFDWIDSSLRAAEDEIGELSRRDEERNTFIRLLLHDVRPALRSCREGLDAISGGEVTPPTVRSLQASLVGLTDLIEGLLDVERFHLPGEVQENRVDLAIVAREVVGQMPLDHVECQLHPAVTVGDAFLLQRVVDNLVRNAVVHTEPETAITVRTWSDEAGTYLEVADDGPGIPADQTEQIFEPFIQLNARERPGVGMGLSLVRHVVEMHGGTCGVVETAGGGATFRVTLDPAPNIAAMPPSPDGKIYRAAAATG